ncbi:glycosyltransferase [Lutibacter sp.]
MKVLMLVGGLENDGKENYTQPFVDRQIEAIKHAGIKVITYNFKGWQKSYNYFLKLPDVRRLIINQKIDVVHAHYSYCAFIAMLKVPVPIVVSLMGSDLLGTFTPGGKVSFRGRFDRWITQKIVRFADWIIVKSQRMANALPLGVPYTIIPNGVNTEVFHPGDKRQARKRLGLNANTRYILFAANPNNPNKNFMLAQKSIEFMNRINLPWKVELLVLYGKPHWEVAEYMRAADVLLMTSYSEGSPNVVKEALCCNLPVISTDVGDVAEQIQGAIPSTIVPFEPKIIAGKIKEVLFYNKTVDFKDHRKRLDQKNTVKQIIDIYQNLINNNRSVV